MNPNDGRQRTFSCVSIVSTKRGGEHERQRRWIFLLDLHEDCMEWLIVVHEDATI